MDKRFIKRIVGIFLVIAIGLVLVNYFGDAGQIYYRKKEINKVLKYVEEKTNKTNISLNCDERICKKYLCEKTTINWNTLILGNSRMLLLSDSVLLNKNLINLSVSGAVIEDVAALYYLARNYKIPQTVILGIDPQWLNENNNDVRWKSLEVDYKKWEAENNLSKERTQKEFCKWYLFWNLFDFDYFQKSFFCLNNLFSHSKGQLTDHYFNHSSTCRYDGSISYSKSFRFQSLSEIETLASTYVYGQWKGFDFVSKQRLSLLEKLIDYILIDNNVNLIVFCPPFHPATYANLKQDEKFNSMFDAMECIYKLANKKNLKIIGQYNPSKCHCDDSCFYDAMHYNYLGLKRFAKESSLLNNSFLDSLSK